jgi:hypothetical protein
MIIEWWEKRCEPEEPPARLESSAKPTAGGLERKTAYTFFYVRLEKETSQGAGEAKLAKDTHEESVADNPLWGSWRGLDVGACCDIENGAETTAIADGTKVQVVGADRPRGSPE